MAEGHDDNRFASVVVVVENVSRCEPQRILHWTLVFKGMERFIASDTWRQLSKGDYLIYLAAKMRVWIAPFERKLKRSWHCSDMSEILSGPTVAMFVRCLQKGKPGTTIWLLDWSCGLQQSKCHEGYPRSSRLFRSNSVIRDSFILTLHPLSFNIPALRLLIFCQFFISAVTEIHQRYETNNATEKEQFWFSGDGFVEHGRHACWVNRSTSISMIV